MPTAIDTTLISRNNEKRFTHVPIDKTCDSNPFANLTRSSPTVNLWKVFPSLLSLLAANANVNRYTMLLEWSQDYTVRLHRNQDFVVISPRCIFVAEFRSRSPTEDERKIIHVENILSVSFLACCAPNIC